MNENEKNHQMIKLNQVLNKSKIKWKLIVSIEMVEEFYWRQPLLSEEP